MLAMWPTLVLNSRAAREYYAAIVIQLIILVQGIDASFTSYFLVGREGLNISDEGILGSVNLFSRAFGALLMSFITDRIGRKLTFQFTVLNAILGWSLILFSTSTWTMALGRFFGGIAANASVSCVIYMAEISHKKRRTTILSTQCIFLSVGMNLPILVAYLFHWRVVAGIALIVSVVSVTLSIPIPESPAWFLLHGRRMEAQKAVSWFRQSSSDHEIQDELDNIEESLKSQPCTKSGGIRRAFQNNRTLFIISLWSMLRAGAGRLAFLSHMEHVVLYMQNTIKSQHLVIFTGIMDLVTSFVYVVIADKFKKTTAMIYYSQAVMVSGLVAIIANDNVLKKFNLYIPLLPALVLVIYQSLLVTVIRTGYTILFTEILRPEIRGIFMNVGNFIFFLFGGIYSYLLPFVLERFHIHTVLEFCLVNIVLLFITTRYFMPAPYDKDERGAAGGRNYESQEPLLGLPPVSSI